MTAVEAIAVAAAVLYLLLAIRQNVWCWPFAAISSVIYVWLFVEARLYMESALYAFYFAMTGYGWYAWTKGRGRDDELPVVRWPWRVHATAIVGIAILGLINGAVLARFSDAAFPYVDSLTTWFAIWTTFLVARKVLENWWYWLVIDVASIFIYWSRDLKLSAGLFVVYVIMIPFGLIAWTRSLREQTA